MWSFHFLFFIFNEDTYLVNKYKQYERYVKKSQSKNTKWK